jgi:putative SOS response-associated peptidase YedK
MCGRFTLTRAELKEVADFVDAEVAGDERDYRPRYNIAPSDLHWLVRQQQGKRQLAIARWGLMAKERPVINARAETVAERPLFREAFRQRRCLIPADGFFEWTGPSSARRPIWFHSQRGLLLFGGIFEIDDPPRFVILTTSPNGQVKAIHDRMPLIIDRADAQSWLEATDVSSLLRPAPDTMLTATPVSQRVNSVANDDPDCIRLELPPQLTLL